MNDARVARRITVTGVVQGVGFRPFVFRLATQHGLAGWVLNDETGVRIHVEGAPPSIADFARSLESESPPASQIRSLDSRPVPVEDAKEFQIRRSQQQRSPTANISPDLAVCDDCLAELFSAADRRHHYPYINCTHCGPRFSIVLRVPYDRPHTTMADWSLCPDCQAEYDNPANRRFHAQPTACPACGPTYQLVWADEKETSPSAPALPLVAPPGSDAVGATVELLHQGRIVAVKGLGGYHLACDARNAQAVTALRERKYRKEKPFAVMVATLEQARAIGKLNSEMEGVLQSAARPIVLVPAKTTWPAVAPDTDHIGLMLPYTPLHHLLFAAGAPSPLVLTSANRSSEPIAYRDDDARDRLSGIADAFLIGQRPIARRVDDSVVAVQNNRPFLRRRARGYAPGVVAELPTKRPVLAVGADLKNSISVVVEGHVIMSQYIGDLGDRETDTAFRRTVADLLEIYAIDTRQLIVACDRHPQFVSTQFAKETRACELVEVQHHRAHIASVAAEHGMLGERMIGVALDGTGWGDDDTIWGFEFFVGSVYGGYERVAHLRKVPMPGGDAAARHPEQAAAGFLARRQGDPDLCKPPFGFSRRFRSAAQLVQRGVRCWDSSSAGRLFDAAAALVGFTRAVSFEGQAAVWLENLARQSGPVAAYPFAELDGTRLLERIISDRMAGRSPCEIAYAFHAALAETLAQHIARLARQHDTDTVAVSGGVLQNAVLMNLLESEVASAGLRLLTNQAVPVNDGGISLGQAALAAVRDRPVSAGATRS